MALVFKDAVGELTTTTGTGAYSLGGTFAGHRTLADAGVADGDELYYRVYAIDGDGNPTTGIGEIGRGTYTAAGPSLSRDVILDGDDGPGEAIDWGAGNKAVVLVNPAAVADLTLGGRVAGLSAVSSVADTDLVWCIQGTAGRKATRTQLLTAETPSSGAGNSIALTASAAADGNTAGGNVALNPGLRSGSGTDGKVTVQQPGGDSSKKLTIRHTGTTVRFEDDGGTSSANTGGFQFFIANGSNALLTLNTNGGTSGIISLGNSASDIRFNTNVRTASPIGWSNSIADAPDISIRRSASNVLRVNAGTTTGGGIVEIGQVASGGTVATDAFRLYGLDVSGTCEAHVKDEAGNETQISPHAMDGPASLYDLADSPPHVVRESNVYLGGVRYLNVSRACYLLEELLKAIRDGRTLNQIATFLQGKPERALDVYHVESFAAHNARLGLTGDRALTQLSWSDVQQQHQDRYDAERAAEQQARDEWAAREAQLEADYAAWLALPDAERAETPEPPQPGTDPEPVVREQRDIRKPVPAWLTARGVT